MNGQFTTIHSLFQDTRGTVSKRCAVLYSFTVQSLGTNSYLRTQPLNPLAVAGFVRLAVMT